MITEAVGPCHCPSPTLQTVVLKFLRCFTNSYFDSPESSWDGQYLPLVPGASMGVPTHDKVMRESSDGQGESELEGPPTSPDLPERLPQNQNLSVLLFYDFHQLF